MFKFFKKGSDSVDIFLNNYPNKGMYFVRTAPWDWLTEKEIYVASKLNDKPTMITMDFWPQEIFLDANGELTVSDLVDLARSQFKNSKIEAPANLSEYLVTELEKLISDLKIVEFSPKKVKLEPKLALPMSKQLKSIK